MSYYAAENCISQSPIEGGIEITADQYYIARFAMIAGQEVTIDGGFAIRDPAPSPEHTWEDGQWVAPPAPEPEPVDLAQYAAQKRWEKEIGGIVVGGIPIYTDDRSKSLIMGARLAATIDPDFQTEWKGANGVFMTVDAATIIAISDAVLAHVAACFALEAGVLTDITNGTITSVEQIDDAFA